MKKDYLEKYTLISISIILFLISFFLIKDIFLILLISGFLAYFLNPIYLFYLGKIKNKTISSILSILTISTFIFLPILYFFYFLLKNFITFILLKSSNAGTKVEFNNKIHNFLENTLNITDFKNIDFSKYFFELITTINKYLLNLSQKIPEFIFSFFVILFFTYYILIYYKEFGNILTKVIPLSKKIQNRILSKIKLNIKVIFNGYFLTALVQTFLATIGYFIFQVDNILILSLLTFILAILPYIGPIIVFIPLSLFLILNGNLYSGIGLLIWGIIVVSTVDNFIRPILMSNEKTLIPPFVFVGIIGGLFTFGIIGIILGPLLLALTSIFVEELKLYFDINSDREDLFKFNKKKPK